MYKIRKKIIAGILLPFSSVLLIILLGSCATAATSVPQEGGASSQPVYYGIGSGDSALKAMADAKRSAVRQAAEDLLGLAAASAKAPDLDQLFGGIKDFNAYVYKESQQTLSSSSGEGFYYHLGIRINLDALAGKLISENILGGQIDGRSGVVYQLNDQAAPAAAASAEPEGSSAAAGALSPFKGSSEEEQTPAADAASDITAEELQIISRYIENLTYMVYFNEDTASDPFLARSAVVSANRFLDDAGYDYVDLARIETIKEEQAMVYEEETGSAVSIIQWIAHKLNADIYIEVSLDTSGKAEGGRYYGTANVSLNCYDASTAEGRGAAVYQTNPPAFSTVSVEDALSNAVSSAVFKGMKAAVAEAEAQSARAASHGFKYSLTMINTPDSKIVRDFEKKLGRRAESVKRTSFSPEESVFEVYLIGDIADLEDLVYDTAESIPGMEGLMLVMQRRNAIIFDTGM